MLDQYLMRKITDHMSIVGYARWEFHCMAPIFPWDSIWNADRWYKVRRFWSMTLGSLRWRRLREWEMLREIWRCWTREIGRHRGLKNMRIRSCSRETGRPVNWRGRIHDSVVVNVRESWEQHECAYWCAYFQIKELNNISIWWYKYNYMHYNPSLSSSSSKLSTPCKIHISNPNFSAT